MDPLSRLETEASAQPAPSAPLFADSPNPFVVLEPREKPTTQSESQSYTSFSTIALQPPLPSEPPPNSIQQPAPPVMASTMGMSPPIQVPRDMTESEKEAAAAVAQQRALIKAAEQKRKEAADEQKKLEDRVLAALQGRSTAGIHGSKDLCAFIKGHADLEDAAAKTYGRLSALFGQETGSTNDALLGYSSSCKCLQKLHSDLQSQLATTEGKRAEESLAAFDEGARRVVANATTLVADLQGVRERVDKAHAAQESAWGEGGEGGARPAGPEGDPWLASVRYRAALKAAETVEGGNADRLYALVEEMKACDLRRLTALKTAVKAYADGRRSLLQKALENAEELCGMVDRIDVEADVEAAFTAADIRSQDLRRPRLSSEDGGAAGGGGGGLALGGGGGGESGGDDGGGLGVWIPDDAVRACSACQAVFGLLRRKHHCRRCGHVFCDKCSSKTAVLPASFGFHTVPQRVCEPCLDLLQGMTADLAGSNGQARMGNSFEVLKEGPLSKKGGMLKPGGRKQRHYVCTRAGFLHCFESKFDLQPKRSTALELCKVSVVDDDATAFALDVEPVPQAGFFSSRAKAIYGPGKAKVVLKCPGGTVERDEWMAAIQSCSKIPATTAASAPA